MTVNAARLEINKRLLKIKESKASKRQIYKDLLELHDSACDTYEEDCDDSAAGLLDALESFVVGVGEIIEERDKTVQVEEFAALAWQI